MLSQMEYIREFKTLVGDSFVSLPILILGFLFIYGSLTSNIGFLLLFIGHLIVCPAISFVNNTPGPLIYENNTFNAVKPFQWLASAGIVGTLFAYNFGQLGETSYISEITILSAIGILQFFFRDNPISKFFNIFAINAEHPPKEFGKTCNLIPALSEQKTKYLSDWLNHIVFFFSFLFTNAYTVYNEPAPVVLKTTEPELAEKRQQAVDERVSKRRTHAAAVMSIIALLFFLILFYRFVKTDCEHTFKHAIIPLSITMLTAYSFFNLLHTKFGLRPLDLLGIVQNSVNPNLIDKPIVCVGSK